MEFQVPLHTSDIATATADAVSNMDAVEKKNAVADLFTKLKKQPVQIVNADVFDTLYGCVRAFTELEGPVKTKLVATLEAGITELLGEIHEATSVKEGDDEQIDAEFITTLRSAVKMYCFLIQWNIQLQEDFVKNDLNEPGAKKGKGKKTSTTWDWDPCKEKLLGALCEVLNVEGLGRLWNMGIPQDDFIGLFVKTAEKILETASNMKHGEIHSHTIHMLATCLKSFNHPGVLTGLKHLFFQLEHVPLFAAQFAQAMSEKYDDKSVVGIDFIREMADVDPSDASRDSTAKNIQSFIEAVSERLPRVVLANFPLLAPHFEGESYMIRNALVTAIGNILIQTRGDDMDESAKRTRDQLLEKLLAHEHDVKSYTRSRVCQTLSTLCAGQAIPKSFFLRAAVAATDRMMDKAVAVRKAALGLLTMLLQNNPYGGHFDGAFYEEKHRACNEVLQGLVESAEAAKLEEEIDNKKLELAYYAAALKFIEKMNRSMESVCYFLGSSTPSDVQEAISFITAASEFGLASSSEGVRKMMQLIFNKDPAIQDTIIAAFERIYLKADDSQCANKSEAGAFVAKRLLKLVQGSNVAEQVSIEHTTQQLQKQGLIRSDVREALWTMATGDKESVTLEDAQAATKLLSFFAQGNSRVVRDKAASLIGAACAPNGWRDPLIVRYAASACMKATEVLEPAKLQEVVGKFVALGSEPWCAGTEWSPALEQIINLVFNCSAAPLDTLSQMVRKVHHDAASSEAADAAPQLTKLFFMVGHVSLELLVFAEEFDRKVKRRRHDKEKKAAEDQDAKKGNVEEDLNDELGMSEADEVHEQEMFQRIAEGKIVGPGTMLGQFTDLIVAVCASDEAACDLEVRTSAIMALCKCMCISSSFCDKNLRLLFTILEKSKSARVRAMVIVALGDMASRFPNLLEPWNEKMYERLADPEACVRKNAMLVMSHLILNDMIKARGHISHIALCLEDEEPRIREIARLFWAEFSNKQNAIYNVIPDVISNLSTSETVDKDAFQRIMKLLMSYIEKDKQSESLIEKLCHRIRDCKTNSVKVGCDLVFCMAQLNFSTKCVKKLSEHYKCWMPLLHEKEAMAQFDVICGKARRFAKEDMKVALVEFEAKLAGESGDNVGDGAAEAAAAEGETPRAALKPSRAQNKPKGGRAKKAKKKVESEGESEGDEGNFSFEDEGEFEEPAALKKAAKKPATKGRTSRRGVAA